MNEQITNQTMAPKLGRKWIYIIAGSLIGLLVVAAVLGAWYVYVYQGWNPNQIEYRDPKFTDSEKQILNDRLKAAEQALEKASSDNDKYKATMAIGIEHFSLGEFVQARDYYETAAKILPDNATAWAELYVVEYEMANYIRANRAIDKAIAINDASPRYWLSKIKVQKEKLEASDSAIAELYKKAIEKSKSADIHTSYAQYLESKNDIVGAVAQWKLATEKAPDNAVLYQAEITRIQNQIK